MIGYRKLVTCFASLILYFVIPVVFAKFNVSETVTLASLGGLGIVLATFFGANAIENKHRGK